MSVIEGGPSTAGLVQRVQNILLRPKDEWVVIDGEAATPQSLLTGYAGILAAIPAVAGFLGNFLMSHSLFGSAAYAVLTYALSLVAVYVLSIIINTLASSFDGTPNPTQALKAAVYANTAYWVAGVALVIPYLGKLISFAGACYSAYLLYLGIATLMKPPTDKAVGYTVVSVVAYIILIGIALWVTTIVALMFVASAFVAAGAMR